MSQQPVSIPKQPVLKPAEDYYRLRREGIGFIEQMGSRLWTDYNTHDPGITMLEAFCYAITDLAYRSGWDIKDILTPATPPSDPARPYPHQPFFTARHILTINPWTPDDFRRLLIDLDMVRNAWVFCKECACDLHYYAWCEEDELILSYRPPQKPNLQPVKVAPAGLYEILLELETDPELGDLNDRKIERTLNKFSSDGAPAPVTVEVRFPEWGLENQERWAWLLGNDNAFNGTGGASFDLKIVRFGATKTYDVLTDPLLDADGRNDYLRNHWRNIFFVTFEITLQPGGEVIAIENAAIRFFGSPAAKNATTVSDLQGLFLDKSASGLIRQYRSKLIKVAQAVADAKQTLHQHRNLDEDYCRIRGVDIEDVAVCADVEVAPDADIERVQAQIWFEIEQYFNPPIRFYTLKELMDAGGPVEEIFNGPALNNGFIKAEELETAGLKTVLRTSDIVNRLMDIEGVIAVNNLILSKYDAEGRIIKGAADPDWHNGNATFDADKTGAAWLLFMRELHQPRLYHNLSRFLFYKNGLPFLPRPDEAYDTLVQLRGEAERPKIKNAPNDLPIPAGTFRNPEDYFPIQYSFPLTYGVGPDGLPSHASKRRRGQAKQLKAYLMVFEQILGNAFAQIAHTAELFSLNPAVDRTYFIREFSEAVIQGYDDIINGLTSADLEEMTETLPEFHDRRNRFLDHMMARFGEQFSEYALLLNNLQGRQVARQRLIEDKIFFLKAYPAISHDRGKAFNYRTLPCAPENAPGLKKRVSLLLGFPDLNFMWAASGAGPVVITGFQLLDGNGDLWLEGAGTPIATADNVVKARLKAFREVIVQMVLPGAYQVVAETGQYRLTIKDKDGNPLGRHPVLFKTKAEAQALGDELLAWSAHERAIIVEHLLLRPKFPGDALYPACSDGACKTCGDEDPYSFRLTYVMPGWTAPFNVNLEMRGFADRTIRQETPAHLLAKTCWVGNNGFIEDPCDPVVSDLTNLLMTKGLTDANQRPTETEACACAMAIYTAFSDAFRDWYEDKTLDYIHPNALKTLLETTFNSEVDPSGLTCSTILEAALWTEISALMLQHFQDIALFGWQFERFEDAWCEWLEVNAAFDWTEERLPERVEAILQKGLDTNQPNNVPAKGALCQCAQNILGVYGAAFYQWMEENFLAGNSLADFTAFSPPAVSLCQGLTFLPGTGAAIQALLDDRYSAYREVAYRLWIVVNLLSKLRNTYPAATLHDCDDGSDQNPVRLGLTALGSYALRRTLSPDPDTPTDGAATTKKKPGQPVPPRTTKPESKPTVKKGDKKNVTKSTKTTRRAAAEPKTGKTDSGKAKTSRKRPAKSTTTKPEKAKTTKPEPEKPKTKSGPEKTGKSKTADADKSKKKSRSTKPAAKSKPARPKKPPEE
jgi:hypothetical protein